MSYNASAFSIYGMSMIYLHIFYFKTNIQFFNFRMIEVAPFFGISSIMSFSYALEL